MPSVVGKLIFFLKELLLLSGLIALLEELLPLSGLIALLEELSFLIRVLCPPRSVAPLLKSFPSSSERFVSVGMVEACAAHHAADGVESGFYFLTTFTALPFFTTMLMPFCNWSVRTPLMV